MTQLNPDNKNIAPEPVNAPSEPEHTKERIEGLTPEAIAAAAPQPETEAPKSGTTPETQRRKINWKRRMAIGAAIAAVGGAARLVPYMVANHDLESLDNPNSDQPSAGAPQTPGQTQDAETQTSTPEQQPSNVGNIYLADSLYTHADIGDTITVTWGAEDQSQAIYLGKLLGSNGHTPTQQAASALNLISAIASSDLKYSQQLPYFYSDSDKLVNAVPMINEAFQAAAEPNNKNKYVDQLDFFDTPDDPVTFVQGPNDDQGYPTLKMASGTLYAQRVTGGSWQDPANFDKDKAIAITSFDISYKSTDNGNAMTIESWSPTTIVDGQPQDSILPIMQVKN